MSYRMFDYLVPNVNFFGPNAISVVGERCQLLGGKKALLVTDKGLRAIKDGAVDKTLHYLREAGIEVAIFAASSRTRKTPTCATASPCFAANSATSSSPWAAAARTIAAKASASPPPMRAICTSMPESRP